MAAAALQMKQLGPERSRDWPEATQLVVRGYGQNVVSPLLGSPDPGGRGPREGVKVGPTMVSVIL